MCDKHRYSTKVRVLKYVVLYIPPEKYKYSVIIDCDTILPEYYITKRRKIKFMKNENTERCSRFAKGESHESNKRGQVEGELRLIR